MHARDWRRFAAAAAIPVALVALAVLERRRPLRSGTPAQPLRRIGRNLALAAVTAGVVRAIERPLVARIAPAAQAHGLLPRLRLPRGVDTALALVLLDYTLYWWHVLLHRVPLLWRFHLVHHTDLRLDAFTALRFHFGEFLASVPWRMLQVFVIGVRPGTLALWQRLTLLEVLFHHSNLRLPHALERRLVWLLVTPRMHGIHHSDVPSETNSNFSSGLTLWDLLHGTARLDVPQACLHIGAPGWRGQLTVAELLSLPLRTGASRHQGRRGNGPHRAGRSRTSWRLSR